MESQRDPAQIYNRFSTITEVHNIAWPAYETPEYDAAHFLQGIAGTLELFHRSTLSFQDLAEEAPSGRGIAATSTSEIHSPVSGSMTAPG